MSGREALDEFVERVRDVPRQALLDDAAVELLDALDEARLESLLLKGPSLARVLYGSREHRGYGDLDLLVPWSDLSAVRRTLIDLGYSNASEKHGVDDVAGIVHSEVWCRPLEDESALPVMVDLHWRLAGCEAPAAIVWEALAARRAWIELNGRRAGVMAPDGLALHLATHAAQHGPADLKAMADLSRGIERFDAGIWRAAAELAERVDATAAFAAGLRLTAAGANLARDLSLPPTDGLEWAILNRGARPRGTFHLQAFARAQGVRARLDVLRRALLPTRRWIVFEHPWAVDSRARLVAAYALHILRGPMWAARAWRYRRRERRAGR